MIDVHKLVAELNRMSVPDLKERYAEVFGEPSPTSHKRMLIKRIVWRTQALREGGLSERAKRRAAELATDADLRLTPPPPPRAVSVEGAVGHGDRRLPMPGAVLTRDYRGRRYTVKVVAGGFEYDGERFKSLSAVARRITGAHWNGYLFFGLGGGKQ
jgi:hypothetical protein